MKLVRILFILFILLNTQFAQDSNNVNSSQLKHGIQFQVTTLSLRNFDNYTLAYRYLLDRDNGFRLAFRTTFIDEEYDGTQILDSLESLSPRNNSNYDFQLSFQYLNTILRGNVFSFIIGGGPIISFTKQLRESDYYTTNYKSTNKDLKQTFGYGFSLLLGAEYMLSKNVILSGEYGITMLIENGDYENIRNYYYLSDHPDRIDENTGDINKFSLRGIGVNLGISIFL